MFKLANIEFKSVVETRLIASLYLHLQFELNIIH